MTDHRLEGVRSDAILGYMKAIGLLRLVAEQVDPHVRGGWDGPTFLLRTALDRGALEAFFLDRYRPTPVMNPWNGGAGFDEKSRTQTAGKTLDAVAANLDQRWAFVRAVLALSREIVSEIGDDLGNAEKDVKAKMLRALRERYPDEALPWLDAAVVVGRDELDFPRLLGTGGNDGHLDFSVNFLQRALDVIGPKPTTERGPLLRDALDGTAIARLNADVAIGQYAPANAGGVNATTGFKAVSLVNPWDFVLLIEGLLVFAGSVTKRFGAGKSRAAFPFTFASSVAGYGAASAVEETRGEVWAPRWKGFATYRSVANLIRTSRVDVDTASDPTRPTPRAATSGIEAAQAAVSRGVTSGIEGFERVVIAQRNGLAFSATRVGYVRADGADAAAAALAREATRWVNRLRGKDFGAAGREALRAYDDGVFAYSARPDRAALQAWLGRLGELDAALGRTAPDGVDPFRFVDSGAARTIAAALDDGSPEHAIAAGFASLGADDPEQSMRKDLSPIVFRDRRFVYDARSKNLVDHLAALAEAAIRRVRVARDSKSRAPLAGSAVASVQLEPVRRFVDGELNARRLDSLLAGYILLPPVAIALREVEDSPPLSIAWAAVKVLLDGLDPGAPSALSADVPALLLADRAPAALERVHRDLRVALTTSPRFAGRRVRDIRFADFPRPTACAVAALLLPLTTDARDQLRTRVLQPEGYR